MIRHRIHHTLTISQSADNWDHLSSHIASFPGSSAWAHALEPGNEAICELRWSQLSADCEMVSVWWILCRIMRYWCFLCPVCRCEIYTFCAMLTMECCMGCWPPCALYCPDQVSASFLRKEPRTRIRGCSQPPDLYWFNLGVQRENQRWNKLDSSMLKSKNQVTLFVNYSYNSFYDFRFSENTYSEQKVMCQNIGFFNLYGGYIWKYL